MNGEIESVKSTVKNGEKTNGKYPLDRQSSAVSLKRQALTKQTSVKREAVDNDNVEKTNGKFPLERQNSKRKSKRETLEKQASQIREHDLYESMANGVLPLTLDNISVADYKRLQAEMQSMSFKVRALDEKVEKVARDKNFDFEDEPGARGVAFTVRLKDTVMLNSLQTLIFDEVVSNVGEYYDSETGVFKVPFTGRYMFSLTVRAEDQKQINAEIVSEPQVIGQIAAGDTSARRSSASITVVASLCSGDEVYVRETKILTGYYFGEGYTTFTGMLLQ